MAAKLSFDQVNQAFVAHGLELLSKSYKNSKCPLRYRCKVCGHADEKCYGDIKSGRGCPVCGRSRIAESHRYSIGFARETFAAKALKLTDGIYLGSQTPMAYSCQKCGYEGKCRLSDIISKGVGCRRCGIQKRFRKHRLDFAQLKTRLLARGIDVLSLDCMYRGSRIQVRCIICKKIWEAKASGLLKTRCRRCMLRERAKGRTYTTDRIRQSLNKDGVTLLSDYVNSQSLIHVRFEVCGHEHKTTWNQLQRGDRCPKCAPNARLTGEDYLRAERKHRGKLLEKAKNGSLPSLWRCSVGHVFQRCLRSIRDLGTFCTDCSGSYAEMLCRTIVERLFGRPFRRGTRMRGMTSIKGRPLELDIYNEDLKLAVEHNGAHHYEPQENWNGMEGLRIQRLHDRRRRNFCKTNGILLIEIRELGKRTTVEGMRERIRHALLRHGRAVPNEFNQADLSDLPVTNESETYWREVQDAAHAQGLEILSQVFLGADKPLSVRCGRGHTTPKTSRSILQGRMCDECYMEQRRKPIRLSDGRVFESGTAAAKALGVTKEVVNTAVRRQATLNGYRVERITREEFQREER